MTRITVDKEMREKLLNFSRPLELCNEAGMILGRLVPSTPLTDPENWVELTPMPTDEEIRRRIDSHERTYSTQELIEKIKRM
jgi:hypothetical protein